MLRSNCHCGAVELALDVDKLVKLRRCNCSICSRKGAVVASVKLEQLKVVRGQDFLTQYTFNTHMAKHYFCSICGIYTHHQRRSDPTEYGINIACVDGVSIEDYLHIQYVDGKNKHPKDV
ncbi:MAG: GFA family protein [Bdellovibrionota bacterium]|nr:GFA family protein [Deltaproteobacteria bacterium]